MDSIIIDENPERSIIRRIVETAKEILKVGAEIAGELFERASEFCKEVAENISDAMKTAKEVITEVGKKIIEIGEVVVDGVGKVLEITGLTIVELANGVKEIGRAVVDLIKEHPLECISIITSFIGAIVCFAHGNIPAGISFLSSGIMKGVKLINELPDEQRDIYLENIPESMKELYNKHDLGNKTYDEIDIYVSNLSRKCLPELSDQDKI